MRKLVFLHGAGANTQAHHDFAHELLPAIKKCFNVYDVTVYGDSIAYGYGNRNISWFDMLYGAQNALKLAQNGEKITDVLRKIKKDTHSYQTLICAVGINDLLQPTPVLGKHAFTDLLSEYEAVLNIATKKAERVWVQSVLPVRENLFPRQDWLEADMWAHNETITCFNAALADLCQRLNVRFLDFYTPFAGQDLTTLYGDAVHLNDKGQTFLKTLYEKA